MQIAADSVTVAYRRGKPVLAGVSLAVESGESVALIGPSGAGKTTILRLLARTIVPDAGRVLIDGCDLARLAGRGLRTVRASIGVIHQRGDLIPTMSALSNVAVATQAALGARAALRLAVRGPDRRTERACMAALDRLEIGHLADTRIDEMSGGQRQRVAVARLVLQAPRVILADEPTASVDDRTTDVVSAVLRDLVASGAAMVLATHDLNLARSSDRIAAVSAGEIVYDGGASGLDPDLVSGVYAAHPDERQAACWVRPACP